MAQKTHTYTVEKGDKVLPKWIGSPVTVTQYTTPEEAINAGHFENVEALMASANRDRNIMANRAVRKELSTEAGTLETAAAKANAVQVKAPRPKVEGGAAKKEGSGEIKRAKETVSRLETVIRAHLGDEKWLKKAGDYGISAEDIERVRAKVAAETAASAQAPQA